MQAVCLTHPLIAKERQTSVIAGGKRMEGGETRQEIIVIEDFVQRQKTLGIKIAWGLLLYKPLRFICVQEL